MRRPTTARDIAEAARVSRSTMQRALSGDPRISQGAKKHVLANERKLGYRPNRNARALVLSRQPTTYGVILTVPRSGFADEVLRGINLAREKLLATSSAELSIHLMDAIDGDEQARLIDRLVAESVRGIVLVPVDCRAVRSAVERGVRAGVAFVTLASDLGSSRRLCFVGQNNLATGKVAGELMSYLLRPGEKVACIAGSLQFLGHAQRIDGFRHLFLRSRREADIVAVLENFDSAELARKLTAELVRSTPDLRGVFVAGGGIQGVCAGLRARRRGSAAVHVIGYDLVQCRELCKRGEIDFVIDQNPVAEGYRALTVLHDFVLYGDRPAGTQLTRIDIRTRETLNDEEEERAWLGEAGPDAWRGSSST
jgi:LacI family transcriptional regulator